MSTTSTETRPNGPRIEFLMIAAVLIVVVAGLWYVMSQRQQSLRSSPAGLDGLQIWLTSNDVTSYNFAGGWPIDQTTVDLLILPVYDTSLDNARTPPSTKEELLLQQDEYDLSTDVILTKARRVPTLVVLPKWKSGMRLTGLAHPVLLNDPKQIERTLNEITGGGTPELVYATTPFTEFSYQSGDGTRLRANLYAAQMFRSAGCTPLIGSSDAMILGECPLPRSTDPDDGERERVLVLSDPDLLNNHGLRLGDNARIAIDVLSSNIDEGNIVIDYSRASWLRDPFQEPVRERTWADLSRFFGPPFLILWLGGGLLLVLFLWRASLRYGPILRDRASSGAGKALAIEARARLLRLSGQDGALVREYVSARISAVAATLFGPAHAGHYAKEDEFLHFADRQHPDEAARLRSVLANIRQLPVRTHATEAIHLIDEFEQVLEQITHDT
ncbi:hypothetical protein [uncultured Roseibium sp.]|uniref:hypothetical protein n=1 Tax=uncultured Roseibium sp. TaxID=1936171 RepID=UPI002629877B|nr:hypothetical protein [uncultured Roseibium sp.]